MQNLKSSHQKTGDLEPPDASDRFFEGYMTAVAVCPVDIPMEEVIAGVMPREDIASLAVGGTNAIEAALAGMRHFMLSDPDLYAPATLDPGSDDRQKHAVEWAAGFASGISLRHAIWQQKIENEDCWDAVWPIIELAQLHPEFSTPNPVLTAMVEPLTSAEADENITNLPGCILRLFNFRQEAIRARLQPARREGAKVGRNDPCSCGSGRKYKKCCGA